MAASRDPHQSLKSPALFQTCFLGNPQCPPCHIFLEWFCFLATCLLFPTWFPSMFLKSPTKRPFFILTIQKIPVREISYLYHLNVMSISMATRQPGEKITSDLVITIDSITIFRLQIPWAQVAVWHLLSTEDLPFTSFCIFLSCCPQEHIYYNLPQPKDALSFLRQYLPTAHQFVSFLHRALFSTITTRSSLHAFKINCPFKRSLVKKGVKKTAGVASSGSALLHFRCSIFSAQA